MLLFKSVYPRSGVLNAPLSVKKLGDDMSMRYLSGDESSGDHQSSVLEACEPRTRNPLLAEMSFPEKRTSLLIQSALVRSGCDAATLGTAHRYLLDAGVLPLLNALRLHCAYTFAHSLKTMELAVHVARRMGIDGGEHAILSVGALLHDIGKLSVPASLLRAPRRLRKVEIDKIRTHPEVGYDSVSDKRILGWNSVLDIIRHHHEHLDGTGYPFGLTAPRISWRTRCVTVCDVLSALTEDRPYRPAMGRDEAFAILAEMARDGKIDADIVETLRSGFIVGNAE